MQSINSWTNIDFSQSGDSRLP